MSPDHTWSSSILIFFVVPNLCMSLSPSDASMCLSPQGASPARGNWPIGLHWLPRVPLPSISVVLPSGQWFVSCLKMLILSGKEDTDTLCSLSSSQSANWHMALAVGKTLKLSAAWALMEWLGNQLHNASFLALLYNVSAILPRDSFSSFSSSRIVDDFNSK